MCNVFPSRLRCSYMLSLSSMGSGRQRWEESGEAEDVRLLKITRSHNLWAPELGLPWGGGFILRVRYYLIILSSAIFKFQILNECVLPIWCRQLVPCVLDSHMISRR